MQEKQTVFAQEQLLSQKGGRLWPLSLSWTYTQQALANIKNKAMAKFGISKNVRKGNCVCARAALEQESGQATASEFELDLHTTSTRKHQKQSYGYVWHLEKCKTSKLLLFCARAALEQERGQAMTSEFELDLHTTSTRKHQKQSYG